MCGAGAACCRRNGRVRSADPLLRSQTSGAKYTRTARRAAFPINASISRMAVSGGWLRESGFRTQQFPNEQRSHVDQEYHVQHRVENDSRNLRRFQHGEKRFAYGAFQ